MIGHVANELRHHKFREDRMRVPGVEARRPAVGALMLVSITKTTKLLLLDSLI